MCWQSFAMANQYVSMHAINPLNAGPVYIQDKNLVITVPADVLAPDGARPSAGTVLSKT